MKPAESLQGILTLFFNAISSDRFSIYFVYMLMLTVIRLMFIAAGDDARCLKSFRFSGRCQVCPLLVLSCPLLPSYSVIMPSFSVINKFGFLACRYRTF